MVIMFAVHTLHLMLSSPFYTPTEQSTKPNSFSEISNFVYINSKKRKKKNEKKWREKKLWYLDVVERRHT